MEGGGTYRQHLEAAKRAGAKVPELEVPPRPGFLHLVLPAFQELSGSRSFEQGQPLPLRPTEIEAWARLRGITWRNWELELLGVLDVAWLTAMRGQGRRR